MRRTQTIVVIKKKNVYFKQCTQLSTISKQLYNVGLYCFRQALIKKGLFLTPKAVYEIMKKNENWVQLPRKICNQIWRQVCFVWASWLQGLKKYKKNPKGFSGRPKIPRYKQNLNKVTYEKGALGIRGLKENQIRLSQTDLILTIDCIKGEIVEVNILPKNNHFLIKVTYKIKNTEFDLDFDKIAGIDLGLTNLMAVATNQADIPHLLVKGGALKSVNQFWNKIISKLKSKLPEGVFSSSQIQQLTEKRTAKIEDILHKTSCYVVNWLIENRIGVLVIGKNDQWKDHLNLGKRNNQNFIQIPHARLIDLITYKFSQANGIVLTQEESYTSKASALDLDHLPKFKKGQKSPSLFSGKRIKRGLYRSSKGILINSDINGAINIIRKVVRNSLMVDLIVDKQFIRHCQKPNVISLVS